MAELGSGMRVPDHLVSSILEGSCVAFVGAGFSANAPRWHELLAELAAGASRPVREQVELLLRGGRPFDLEAAGQLIRDAFKREHGERGSQLFEERVDQVLRAHMHAVPNPRMETRLRYLKEIPFAAILTTNYDGNFAGWRPQEAYLDVLRRQQSWWDRARWQEVGEVDPRPRAVKLHGDANGSPADNPVVLGKEDYRRLLYQDGRYGNFLRSVFATKTMLFLGVSFTDAYLNELRAEVLALLGTSARDGDDEYPSIGYAVLCDQSVALQRYFRDHEGIQVLNFENTDGDFAGFDAWLEAIHSRTAPVARLRKLLSGQNVLWLDPYPANNEVGISRLRDEVGANVHCLSEASQLDAAVHSTAQLLITHFGHRQDRDPVAFDVLRTVGQWGDRPPVIVFCDPAHAAVNRSAVLRHGAYELASDWAELFELVESLFGRR